MVSSFYGLILTNGATAGDMTYFYLAKAGSMQFHDTSNAFLGTFVLEGRDSVSVSGGTLEFSSDDSSAGNATLTVNGGNAPSSSSGIVSFLGGTADNGVFILNGGTADRALGGRILIRDGSAGNATVIANPGTNGGYGGEIQFAFGLHADHDTARIEVFGNRTLNMTDTYFGEETIGSLEGDGIVKVNNPLNIGANNLSTTFAGTNSGGSS